MADTKTVKQEELAEQPRGAVFAADVDNPEDLVLRILADMLLAEASKQEWMGERNRDVKAYFGIKNVQDWPFKGAAKISSGFHRIAVDTLCANVMKSIFAPEDVIQVRPTNLESLEAAKYVSDLMNHGARNEFRFRAILDHALPNALVESFSVLKPIYDHSTVEVQTTVRRWVPEDKQDGFTYELETNTVVNRAGNTVISVDPDEVDATEKELKDAGMVLVPFDVTQERVIKDGVTIYVIGGSRIYLPVWAPGNSPFEAYQNSPFVIQQTFPTIAQLEAEEEAGEAQNVGIVKNEVFKRLKPLDKRLILRDRTSQRIGLDLILTSKYQQTGYSNDFRIKRELAEVLEWHGQWDVKGRKREVVARIDRASKTLLSCKLNLDGVRPFFPLVPFPVDETPFGESLPKIIRTQVAELDLLINTVINIGLMKSMPPKFYDPAGGFNPQSMGNFGPNSWIPTREPSKNVYIPPQPEEPQVSFQMINLLMSIIERMTSINEVVQGEVSKKANTTAYEVSQALSRSGVRFDMLYERIKAQMAPMFDYIYRLNLRHMPFSKELMIMGDSSSQTAPNDGSNLIRIFRDKIKGHFFFELAGGSIISESAELQNAVLLYNTVGQDPYLTYLPESKYYTLFNIIKRLNPVAMDKILATPDQVKAIERQRAAVQAQQEQQALAQSKAMGGQPGQPGQPTNPLAGAQKNNQNHLVALENMREQRRLTSEQAQSPASQA